MKTLKERIDQLRGAESMTDFASRVGISRGTLYDAYRRERENDGHGLDLATAKLIAVATGHPVAWILGEQPTIARVQTIERDAMRAAGEDKSMPPDLKNVMPALAHELDPTTQDAMRWRALAELQNDGADVTAAFHVLGSVEFQRDVRAVSWGDFYAAAKRALKDSGKPAGDHDLDP